MSRKYKFTDNSKLYFITFAVINWIDLFIRNEYRSVLLNTIRHCQLHKGLEVYGWCIMTSHVHMIIGSHGEPFSDIMRDLKRHSSEMLHKLIEANKKESRREWMLQMMKTAATENKKVSFQLWQPENHPIELYEAKVAHQKLEYMHSNPVVSGFVSEAEDWLFSSARDYAGKKGLLDVILLDPMMPQ